MMSKFTDYRPLPVDIEHPCFLYLTVLVAVLVAKQTTVPIIHQPLPKALAQRSCP